MTPEEMEYRIKHLEYATLALLEVHHIHGLGICVNASLDDNDHPHWTSNPRWNWSRPVLYIPRKEREKR